MNEVAMNENKAIKICNTIFIAAEINNPHGMPLNATNKEIAEAMRMAGRALEEVQQYREIGKVSTCKNAVEICRAMIERGIEPENVEAYIAFEDTCVKKGFTIKGLLEAGEKQTAKRPITYERTNRADCPVCGATVRGISKPFGGWCSYCGQKLDWSDDE